MKKLLIRNIGMLATPLGRAAHRGAEQGNIELLRNAWVLVEEGIVTAVGAGVPDGMICAGASELDAGGRLVTPGLVDAHTHLVFGGWRQNELALKLRGVSYLEILERGGGILSTVRATRQAGEQALYERARAALDEMLSMGVTTVEAKSGYGLDWPNERKQLQVIRSLGANHAMDVAATFLGAHALPAEYKNDREGYLRLLCEEMIPAVAREGLAQFCDVFCEKGVFSKEESRRVLETGKRCGLIPKIHADEIESIGGSQLAGEVGAISAEHLIVCPQEGIAAMAKAGTVACCLPATSFYLGAAYAPARAMVDAGVPVAMASDFNPGSCPSLNLQLVMNLGCLKYRLTPEEVLTAVTLNGAAAIDMAGQIGSVEVGKQGDLVIWDAPDLNYICYRMGSNLAAAVIKRGAVVYARRSAI
ncbi:MAG: imidazolonepropionase [Ruminococcaceae bacterium]|jgi:imidazolonepropionase|nr:imidazolonepropionase [Oscillospiraceae bacterium]